MFEIADRLLAAIDAGERVAVATTVSITGSAPRSVGTSMAVTESGEVLGSVSGGCVEGAVYELCQRVLQSGAAEFASYGFSDDVAFSVGLSCGGRIEVVATVLASDEASAPAIDQLRLAASGRAATVSVVVDGGTGQAAPVGRWMADATVCDDARVFTESSEPPAGFIIFGAVEFAVALCNAASVLGYRVTVCDPRSAFATAQRFPSAAEVVVEWPTDFLADAAIDDRTVICILSHDDRFDVDLIEAALARGAAYVGAMGSRSTHEKRMARLDDRAVDTSRLHSPIGLDLGASTPEETAVSILAEVLRARTGRSAESLSVVSGSIHR